MSLDPILTASLTIQLHVIGAILAIVVGPVALLRKSRDRVHKIAGYIWVVSMYLAAGSSLFISEGAMLGPFGPIHILSFFTLFSLTRGMMAIFKRDIKRHQAEMRALYFWALGVAGLFTFLPGRRMNTALFGDNATLGFAAAAVVLGAALMWYQFGQRRVAG